MIASIRPAFAAALLAAALLAAALLAAAVWVAGQLVFENLGIVTGVAAAVYGLATDEGREPPSRPRRALGRLGGLAAVSLAAR